MRRILRPVAYDVRDFVIDETTIRDPQVAEVNKIIRPIPMLRKRILGTRVQKHLGKSRAQCLNRLLMRQKDMPQLYLL